MSNAVNNNSSSSNEYNNYNSSAQAAQAAAKTDSTDHSSHSTQFEIMETFFDVVDDAKTEGVPLVQQTKATIAILRTLTGILTLANQVELATQDISIIPLGNSAVIPRSGSEGAKAIQSALADVNEKIDDPNSPYNGYYWDVAFRDALAADEAAAMALVAQGVPYEEAIAQQSRAADVLNAFLQSDDADDNKDVVAVILQQVSKQYFQIGFTLPYTEAELAQTWASLLSYKEDLVDLLEIIDPDKSQRTTPNTLAFYMDQIIKDIESIENGSGSDAAKATEWIYKFVTGEGGTSSSFRNNLDNAITLAQNTSADQRTELQKLLVMFQAAMSSLSAVMKSTSDVMVHMAQNAK